MGRIIEFVLKRPKTVILLVLLLSMPLGYAFQEKQFLDNISIYFDRNDPAIRSYESFRERYGNEEAAIIVLHAGDVFTNPVLEIVRRISESISSLDGVQQVFSLTEIDSAAGLGDMVVFEPLIPPGSLNSAQLREIRERVLRNPFATETLVSESGDTTAIIVELSHFPSVEQKGEVLSRIIAVTEQTADGHVARYYSGTPFVEHEISSLTRQDDRTLTPLVIALLFIIILLVFRRITLSALCLVNVGLTMVWTVGLFVLAGNHFNMVTVVLGPIVMAIAVTDSVHILSRLKANQGMLGKTRQDAIRDTAAELWYPCLFTSLTTGIGFLSFTTATISPVRTLGLFAFSGIMIAYVMTIVLLPACIAVFDRNAPGRAPERYPAESTMTRILQSVGRFTLRNCKGVCILFMAVIGFSLAGAAKINFETNLANHLKETHKIRQGVRFVEENLFGTVPVAVLVRAKPGGDDFTHPESLALLDEIQSELKNRFPASYTSFFSIADYFKEIHRAFNSGKDAYHAIPAERADIVDYYELGDPAVFARLVSPDRMEARLSFNTYLDAAGQFDPLESRLKTFFSGPAGDDFSYEITGLSSLYNTMDKNLRTSQLRSFALAFTIIFLMMAVVCRNLKLAVIAMFPNLFPILCTFGLMGYFGIPLDVSTIMIASVTIGIAVDDTVHYLVWYRRNAGAGMDTESALLKTYTDTGKPILITSIILSVSFFSLLAGSSYTVQAFGALTGLALLFTLAGDLLLLPALIMVFKPGYSAGFSAAMDRDADGMAAGASPQITPARMTLPRGNTPIHNDRRGSPSE